MYVHYNIIEYMRRDVSYLRNGIFNFTCNQSLYGWFESVATVKKNNKNGNEEKLNQFKVSFNNVNNNFYARQFRCARDENDLS